MKCRSSSFYNNQYVMGMFKVDFRILFIRTFFLLTLLMPLYFCGCWFGFVPTKIIFQSIIQCTVDLHAYGIIFQVLFLTCPFVTFRYISVCKFFCMQHLPYIFTSLFFWYTPLPTVQFPLHVMTPLTYPQPFPMLKKITVPL